MPPPGGDPSVRPMMLHCYRATECLSSLLLQEAQHRPVATPPPVPPATAHTPPGSLTIGGIGAPNSSCFCSCALAPREYLQGAVSRPISQVFVPHFLVCVWFGTFSGAPRGCWDGSWSAGMGWGWDGDGDRVNELMVGCGGSGDV